MKKKRSIFLLCGMGIIIVLTILVWQKYRNASLEETELVDPWQSKEAKAGVQADTVVSVKISPQQNLSCLLIENFSKLLECEKYVGVASVKFFPSRQDDKLEVIAWTSRGPKALYVSGFDSIKVGLIPKKCKGIQARSSSEIADLADLGVLLMPLDVKGITQLFVKSKSGSKKFPLGDFWTGNTMVATDAHYAVTTKEIKNGRLVSVLLVDLLALSIIDEIELPKGSGGSPEYVFDSKTECLVVMDYDLKWCMIVDIKALSKKK